MLKIFSLLMSMLVFISHADAGPLSKSEASNFALKFLNTLANSDYKSAYQMYSNSAKRVINFGYFKSVQEKQQPVQEPKVAKITIYNKPAGRFIAVDFVGKLRDGGISCGYVIVLDENGVPKIIRSEVGHIPVANLKSVSKEKVKALKIQMGCRK